MALVVPYSESCFRHTITAHATVRLVRLVEMHYHLLVMKQTTDACGLWKKAVLWFQLQCIPNMKIYGTKASKDDILINSAFSDSRFMA